MYGLLVSRGVLAMLFLPAHAVWFSAAAVESRCDGARSSHNGGCVARLRRFFADPNVAFSEEPEGVEGIWRSSTYNSAFSP
jgi:hypothetical protein